LATTSLGWRSPDSPGPDRRPHIETVAVAVAVTVPASTLLRESRER
jgi:hypothetical protein